MLGNALNCVVEIALEPKSKADQAKLRMALACLADEDPSFKATTDARSGQTIIAGLGELHLEILVDRLEREFEIDANIGKPQIVYRETLGQAAEVDYTHRRKQGSAVEFARVKLLFEPIEPGRGFVFESKMKDGSAPHDYIRGAEQGVKSVAEAGIIRGFPVIDFKAALLECDHHEADSSALAVEIAARTAFRQAAKSANMQLLEPIMSVEVVTPTPHAEAIIKDLEKRRGRIWSTITDGEVSKLVGQAPMPGLLGVTQAWRKNLPVRVSTHFSFSHYAPAPPPEPSPAPPDGSDPDDTFPPAIGMRLRLRA